MNETNRERETRQQSIFEYSPSLSLKGEPAISHWLTQEHTLGFFWPIHQLWWISIIYFELILYSRLYIPSGGLTLIVGTQKWGFSCKVQRRPPADIIVNESLPPKTPCGHHVHGRHGHGSSVKNRWRISNFRKKNTKLWPPL